MDELKSFARLIVANTGVAMGPNAINRLVIQFNRHLPNANGWAFFLYIANAIQMSEKQRRAALLDPDIARVISYTDHTGEAAVNNVLRREQHHRT
jgi:hypothetical protein